MSEYCSFDVTEIDMPKHLIGKYQKFTRADTDKLVLEAGYNKPFHSLHGGIKKYFDFWNLEKQ